MEFAQDDIGKDCAGKECDEKSETLQEHILHEVKKFCHGKKIVGHTHTDEIRGETKIFEEMYKAYLDEKI